MLKKAHLRWIKNNMKTHFTLAPSQLSADIIINCLHHLIHFEMAFHTTAWRGLCSGGERNTSFLKGVQVTDQTMRNRQHARQPGVIPLTNRHFLARRMQSVETGCNVFIQSEFTLDFLDKSGIGWSHPKKICERQRRVTWQICSWVCNDMGRDDNDCHNATEYCPTREDPDSNRSSAIPARR